MTNQIAFFVFSCVLYFSVFGAPIDENKSSISLDKYEESVKLLTGGKTAETCDQSKNDLGECLKQLFTDINPHISHGIPELSIPAIEPLKLNRTTIQFNIGSTSGRLMVKNGVIYGLGSHVLKKVDFKVENGNTKMNLHSFVPVLHVAGDYKAELAINNRFHFKPHGNFNLTLSNVDIIMSSEGKIFEKDGHKFVRLHKIDASPTIGDLNIDINGLFEDPELSQLVSGLAKDYWREVYAIMLPETKPYWEPLILDMLNQSLSLIPFDAFVKTT